MQALGIGPVPCVVRGDQHLSVQHVDQLRVFLGLPPAEPTAPYQVWAAGLLRVLEAVERVVRQLPSERLGEPTPNRGRDLRQLVFNIHDAIRAMRDSLDTGRFNWDTKDDYVRSRPFGTTEELADFCSEIRRRWFRRTSLVDDEEAGRQVETRRGTITQQQLLESQAWHAAQHLRQIYLFVREIGIEPASPLSAEEMWPVQLGELIY